MDSKKIDQIVESNVELLRSRSAIGIEKYGTTLADSNLPMRDRLNHALLEALDQANYLQWAIQACDQSEAAPQVTALVQASRAKKIGGSYQAEGTIVSTFATLAGETRHVFEFDQPAGMLHIFGPGQVEIAASVAAPQVVADDRAYTAEEARDQFMDQVRHLVSHWERESREPTVKGKLEGLAFSIMNIFDGTSGLPAFNIVCAPHPDDKQYCIDDGSKYFAPGMVINDCHLHEMLFSGRAAAPVQAQEPVLVQAFEESGSDRESGAWFDIAASEVKSYADEGYKVRKLFTAPVQPVAVPDVYARKSIGDNVEFRTLLYRYSMAFMQESKKDEDYATSNNLLLKMAEFIDALAAPAAQGDDKSLAQHMPESIETDDALWRSGCTAFRLALNEMTGRDGYVVKKTYEALRKHILDRAAIAAKAAS